MINRYRLYSGRHQHLVQYLIKVNAYGNEYQNFDQNSISCSDELT